MARQRTALIMDQAGGITVYYTRLSVDWAVLTPSSYLWPSRGRL